MQARHLIAILFLVATACPAARGEVFGSVVETTTHISQFQYGYDEDDYKFVEEGELERWGAGGAKPLNFRLTFQFASAYLMHTDFTDAANSPSWNDIWRPGLGGCLGFGVQLAPILRVGGGAGYLDFHGGKIEYGTTILDYRDIHFFPIYGAGTLCLPLDLSLESWFTPGLGFARGLVPYVQIEFGTSYHLVVKADQTIAAAPGPEMEILKSGAGVFVGARIGLEFRTESVAFYFSAGYRLFNAPKAGRDLVDDPLEMHSIPIEAGFALYFG